MQGIVNLEKELTSHPFDREWALKRQRKKVFQTIAIAKVWNSSEKDDL